MKGLANIFQPQFPFKGVVAAMAQMGFNPRTLFANNVPGVWFDPSDLSTLFQDTAGTLPVTGVEQPVGLMLDKSRPLGPNLAPSTGSLSGWTLVQTGGSVTVVDGGLFLNTTGTGAVAAFFGGLTSSARYLFEFEVVSVSGLMFLEYGAGGVAKLLVPGKHRWCITNRSAFYLRNAGAASTSGSLLIKNVVVRIAPGNHASQSTTTARPILRAESAGGTQQYYLDFDGVDDFMSTASTVDLSTTSELAAMAAVYVPPEQTARATVLELGPSYANPGCIGMEAPMFSATLVGMGYRGNGVEIARSVSASKDPLGTVVFGGTLDLNAPLVQLRVNSTNRQQSTLSVGPGPFANATLFLGARNGNSQRFKGRLYGAVICGKRVLSPELNSLEQFLRTKSRAY